MSRMFFVSRRLSPLLAFSVASLAACSDGTAPAGSGNTGLSFTSRGNLAASGATATPNGTILVSGTDTLRITSAKVVVDELELERGLDDHCDDDGSDNVITIDASCAELEVGPYLVNLPVNGTVSAPMQFVLPAGTYHELEMKVRLAHEDTGEDAAFRAAHPEMTDITVRVEGTWKGAPFTWTGNVEVELELDFSPPLVVDGAGNFTVNIDVGRWFRSGAAAIIDPVAAVAGTEAHALVAANIRSSFEVYEDDDHDGHDDSN